MAAAGESPEARPPPQGMRHIHSVIPLVLRHMRGPLLTLIVTYSVAVLGLVLIPGETPAGEPHRVTFLDAFYFVSFTATTIGFGEIPHNFTSLQRLWVLLSLYMVVIAWFYAIGTIVGLIRDPAFQQAVTWGRFARAVRRMTEPFYLVCGYGDTGTQLVRAITDRGQRAVALDWNDARVSELSLANLRSHVPGVAGDANQPENLVAAGLKHTRLAGVLAVTDDDHTNLQIAISSKLLNPSATVIARAELAETKANMLSFGTDYVVNPFEAFAGGLAMAVRSPNAHLLYERLSAIPDQPISTQRLPPDGTWLVCGYGRLGHYLHTRLTDAGVSVVVVAPNRPGLDYPYPHVDGKGTEAPTLEQAGIREAAGLVAATDDDADNLSIVMTARDLNPELFLVGRQNQHATAAIFQAAQLDMVLEPSSMLAVKFLRVLSTPLLPEFLGRAREKSEEWLSELLERLEALDCPDGKPHVWTLAVTWEQSPALMADLEAAEDDSICLEPLLRDPRSMAPLSCVVLMHSRGQQRTLLPGPQQPLAEGDRLLLAGTKKAAGGLAWTVNNVNALRYLATGVRRPDGTLWRWLASRRSN